MSGVSVCERKYHRPPLRAQWPVWCAQAPTRGDRPPCSMSRRMRGCGLETLGACRGRHRMGQPCEGPALRCSCWVDRAGGGDNLAGLAYCRRGPGRPRGQVAQLVEHCIENAGVGGSNPPLAIFAFPTRGVQPPTRLGRQGSIYPQIAWNSRMIQTVSCVRGALGLTPITRHAVLLRPMNRPPPGVMQRFRGLVGIQICVICEICGYFRPGD